MIETIVLNYLSSVLDVSCYMEHQENPPEKYIIIEKTGGGSTNKIESGTIAIQSYADTLYEAALLNEDVKRAMENIVILDDVSACTLNSDYNFTDTTKKQYRYQAVFNLVYFNEVENG